MNERTLYSVEDEYLPKILDEALNACIALSEASPASSDAAISLTRLIGKIHVVPHD